MKKIIGIILLIVGLAGLVIYGIQAASDSESFSVLGMDVAVSSANWTPVIISGIIFLLGLVVTLSTNRKSA